ncbi:carbohydrate ABC transporter permease [Clostridia bacterium]|nr:carbohydrate ABC transporter permease [Clostridia bacterium]
MVVTKKNTIKIITYILLIAGCFVMLFPFFWMLSTSVKNPVDVFKLPVKWIPDEPVLSNYTRVITEFEFLKYMRNSLILSIANTIGSLFSCTLVAYAFATQKFKYKKQLFVLILATMMLPGEVIFFPQFILYNFIGWYGTMKPLWVPSFFGNAFYIFLLRQYFLTIPAELSNAARIDGCNAFKIFWKIYIPMSKPALAVVAIYTFMTTWNDFFGPLIYITKEEYRTASIALYYLRNTYETTSSLPMTMAAAILTIIPCLALYYFGQRFFTRGIVFKGIDK